MASFKGTYTNDVIAVLKGNINALELSIGERTDYQALADEYQKAFGQNNRITMIGKDGEVLADTQADSEEAENHLERPEVRQALAGGFGTAVRYSETTGKDMIYVAKQLPDGLIIRNSMPLDNVTAVVNQTLNEGLMIMDDAEDVLLINTAAKKIFGITGEAANENILHYVRRPDVVSKLERSLKKKKNMQFEMHSEETGRTYRFYTSIADEPAFLDGKGGYAMHVLISDVTDIELSERVRRDFAANVSHELKTPLTSINGFAQLVANGMAADAESVKAYAKRISEESDRLMGLINDTLMLSELEQISIEEPMEDVNIRETTEEVLRLMEDRIAERHLDVQVTGNAEMKANRNRIRELVMNLCDNAVKYNKDHGKIVIGLSEKDGYAAIEVQDTGIGIPENEINRIFERFYRAKNSGGATVNGTGLGLAIVKHIAALYEGELTVESREGEGSRFTVRMKKE